MLIYFFTIFFLYYVFILLMLYGWGKTNNPLPNRQTASFTPFISVIIAVRNEEKNIPQLMDCLSNQSYARDHFEVIFVDDHSEDNTIGAIEKAITKDMKNVHIMKPDFSDEKNYTPKKAALIKGINASIGTIIMMTDGDCWFGKDWIKSVSAAFYDDKTMFVAGAVALKGSTKLLSKIQALEFSSLIGSSGAFIGLNYPIMCNGANLAFRKDAFSNVNGYQGFAKETSGDDVFLMQKIHRVYKHSITFLKDQKSIVYSNTLNTISELISQRKRWASKWDKYPLPFSRFIPIFLFIHYLSIITLIVLVIISPQSLVEAVILLLTKIFLDGLLMKKVMDFCKLKFDIFTFLVSEVLYPFYAIFIGISVQFGNYNWKGRSYKV